MFAARDVDDVERLELGVGMQIVGDHGLFDPTHVVGRQHAQHAPRMFEVPAHIGVGHDVDIVAHGLARRLHQSDVLVHALDAVLGAPAEAELD